MARTTTIGLAGCGIWGLRLLHELVAIGIEVAVADPDPAARQAALSAGATRAAADAGALPDTAALIVATPAVTHHEVVARLLPRGVPLLVEKPFTTDLVSAERLAAEGEGRIVLGHTWRYHPGIELLGGLARAGTLGTVLGLRSTRANWTSPRTDVDSVWNLAPHDLTLAIEILGAIPEPRAAVAEMHDGRAVGMTAILGERPSLVFDVSNRYRDKRREVRVHGTLGVAVMRDPDDGEVEIAYGDAATPPAGMRVETRTFSRESALGRELQAFLRFVDGGPPPKSSAAEGVAVVRCIADLRRRAGLDRGWTQR
jgi:predicted dehydrogenase